MMLSAAVSPLIVSLAVAGNLVTIILAVAAFWRFGRHAFSRAIREEVAPTLDALQRHTDDAARTQKKLKKSQAHVAGLLLEHTESDQEQFKEVLGELKSLNVQGSDAAEKVVAVATSAAERVAATAATAAIQAEKVAIGAADAAKLVAADAALSAAAQAETVAERVAAIAAEKAVALLEAQRKEKPN